MSTTETNANAEIADEGLVEQLKHFSKPYWIANVMEMFERLAYYGLRTVLPIYMVLSVEEGGPQFTHVQKGVIYAWWAAVQSGLPIFTGGYADRYGYKLTVGVSIAIKVIGYLLMAYALELAALISGGASVGVPGHAVSYVTFGVGAMFLAAGTAVFKPGLQGIIAVNLDNKRASLGWSVFYQLVNVGGFLGPILAGVMRLMAWKWVFISCAVIVSLNYLFLLTFEEPAGKNVQSKDDESVSFLRVFWNSSVGILEPRLFAFLVIFSGFWMMFHQLFDLLPNFIDDWVDSRGVIDSVVRPVFTAFGGHIPEQWKGNLPQEYMINVNAGMCMLLAFIIGYWTGKIRSMAAMISGIMVSAGAIYALGLSDNGWSTILAIAAFSIGELMASPTKMRYFGSIAPPGKKGLYMGYINATGGIGWAIGSHIAGKMYEADGDKVVLARRYLVDHLHQDAAQVAALAKTAVIPRVGELLHKTAEVDEHVRQLLWETYQPQRIWSHFAIIGLISMGGLILFDIVTRKNLAKDREWAVLLGLTILTSSLCYSWVHGLIFGGLMCIWILLKINAPKTLPN
ncbi:MAG: MFS transporter [Myxococcales bacterium]|nr:MFS transporter [Myxococcales bacterium]